MTATEEGWHNASDGKQLYTKSWRPSDSPIATIAFIHGFSDHCNRWDDYFTSLAAEGILIHAFDQRGWGHSASGKSEKGKTGPTSRVMDDITSFIKSHLPSSVPLFLAGHSMGGQETLYYAATGPSEVKQHIRGYIAQAPYIRLHPKSQPGWLKVNAGKLASKVLPHMTLVNTLDPDYLSNDKARNLDWLNDPLCHDTGTLEGLAGMLDRGDALDTGRVSIADSDGMNILLLHGTNDQCTSSEATKEFMAKLKVTNKTLKLYEDTKHNIHWDPASKDLKADVLSFIKACLKPKESSAKEAPYNTSKL